MFYKSRKLPQTGNPLILIADLKMTPESGILTACIGRASVSAACWLENQLATPVWRSLRNSSRLQTSVLSGRRARLALRNVDISDDGRVFECVFRSLNLTRRLTVKVEGVCETCGKLRPPV